MPTDRSHLIALEMRRIAEIGYRAKATSAQERELRSVWIAQIDREIEGERAFLGLAPEAVEPEMSIDEILAQLDEY